MCQFIADVSHDCQLGACCRPTYGRYNDIHDCISAAIVVKPTVWAHDQGQDRVEIILNSYEHGVVKCYGYVCVLS